MSYAWTGGFSGGPDVGSLLAKVTNPQALQQVDLSDPAKYALDAAESALTAALPNEAGHIVKATFDTFGTMATSLIAESLGTSAASALGSIAPIVGAVIGYATMIVNALTESEDPAGRAASCAKKTYIPVPGTRGTVGDGAELKAAPHNIFLPPGDKRPTLGHDLLVVTEYMAPNNPVARQGPAAPRFGAKGLTPELSEQFRALRLIIEAQGPISTPESFATEAAAWILYQDLLADAFAKGRLNKNFVRWLILRAHTPCAAQVWEKTGADPVKARQQLLHDAIYPLATGCQFFDPVAEVAGLYKGACELYYSDSAEAIWRIQQGWKQSLVANPALSQIKYRGPVKCPAGKTWNPSSKTCVTPVKVDLSALKPALSKSSPAAVKATATARATAASRIARAESGGSGWVLAAGLGGVALLGAGAYLLTRPRRARANRRRRGRLS